MRRKAPPVNEFMTRLPHELDRRDTIARAKELMLTEDIRHVPVMDGAKLFGIISERDVDVILATVGGLRNAPAIELVCEENPYAVSPLTPVTEVAQEMELRKVGSAVVIDGGVVVGIFTLVDALRALRHAYR